MVTVSRGGINAGQSLQDILLALGRVNWGPLRGRAWAYRRMVLQTLALMMREQKADYMACLVTTAPQLADRIGSCEKTVRNCLQDLEDLQVIEWRRGGIWDGKPMPSVLRVNKWKLVDWVKAWRPRNDKRLVKRRAETLARLAQVHHKRMRAPQRVGAHAEPNTSLSSHRKSTPFERACALGVSASPKPAEGLKEVLDIRKLLAPMRKQMRIDLKRKAIQREKDPNAMQPKDPAYYYYLPAECSHHKDSPRVCNFCRHKASRKFTAVRNGNASDETGAPADYPPEFLDYCNEHYPVEEYPNFDGPWRYAKIAGADPVAAALLNASA